MKWTTCMALAACLFLTSPIMADDTGEKEGKKVGEIDKDLLKKKIEAYKKKSAGKLPPQVKKIFVDGIRKVAQSEVMKRAKKKGDTAPDFTLPSHNGKKVNLGKLLKQGPVVIIWYRGGW